MKQKILESFEKNFNETNRHLKNDYLSLFNPMADALCVYDIKDVFVDVGFKKGIVDINVFMEDGWFLSIAKTFDNEGDEVMFTIEKKEKTLDIGMDSLNDALNEFDELRKLF